MSDIDFLRGKLSELTQLWDGQLECTVGYAKIRVTWDRNRSFEVDILLCENGESISLLDDELSPSGRCIQTLESAKKSLLNFVGSLEKSGIFESFQTAVGVKSYFEKRLDVLRFEARNSLSEKQNIRLDQFWQQGQTDKFLTLAAQIQDLSRVNLARLAVVSSRQKTQPPKTRC
jgi:hypothetical protein